MSQFQPNAAPGKSFISKINSKFLSLSLSSTIQTIHSDKDGSTPDTTLIHQAFVNYFNQRNEPYPAWLGEEVPPPRANRLAPSYPSQQALYLPRNQSQYQPVRANYNTQRSELPPSDQDVSRKPSYTPRSSKLLDLYNKSRQQAVPGAGYNVQLSRANSTGGSTTRLRDRVYNSPSMNGLNQAAGSSKPTWGRK